MWKKFKNSIHVEIDLKTEKIEVYTFYPLESKYEKYTPFYGKEKINLKEILNEMYSKNFISKEEFFLEKL